MAACFVAFSLKMSVVGERRFSYGYGFGVRREVLHQRMMERARDCGVSLMWNTPVMGLYEEGVVAGGNKIQARWVIGADGSSSRVRRWSGLESLLSKRNRFGFRQHFRLEPWTDFTEIHWGEAAQAYVTPVGAEEICVVLISNKPNLRFDEGLRMFPKLAHRLKLAPSASPERGAVTRMFDLKRVVACECRAHRRRIRERGCNYGRGALA